MALRSGLSIRFEQGNPPDFRGDLEVGFSRYFERGDSDEEEQIYRRAGHGDIAPG